MSAEPSTKTTPAVADTAGAQPSITVGVDRSRLAGEAEGGDYFSFEGKDEKFVYRWCNSRDRIMLQRRREGWESAPGTDDLPQTTANIVGQPAANPAGGTVRQRGDVILMRMPREVHEARVTARNRAARERQNVTIDTMVERANEDARSALRKQGYQPDQIRGSHVFKSSPDGKF